MAYPHYPEYGAFPDVRLRRLRASGFMRALTREHEVSMADVVWPLFVVDQPQARQPIASLPGVYQLGRAELWQCAEQAMSIGIQVLALFAVVPTAAKDQTGSMAVRGDGFMPRLIAELKAKFPQLGIIADVALDPYTSHGHDGIIDAAGEVLNDPTVALLAQQAVSLAAAGADVVAPSDMMDGRIKTIRQALDNHKLHHTAILAYSAKYASALYGPFRDAVGSPLRDHRDAKLTYQLSYDRYREALREVAFDLKEGADMVMIKPAAHNTDVVRGVAHGFGVPTFAYQVSGEYAMIKAAAQAGWLDERGVVMEQLVALKRAGASGIFTYFAPQLGQWLAG